VLDAPVRSASPWYVGQSAGGVADGDVLGVLVDAVDWDDRGGGLDVSVVHPARTTVTDRTHIARRRRMAGLCPRPTEDPQSSRSCTAIVSSRPGPTPTAEMRTPIIDSSADR
jgi:hypothetical protein